MYISNTSIILGTQTIANLPTGGPIGASSSTVDISSSFSFLQTTVGQNITIPAPTVPLVGQVISLVHNGTAGFTLQNQYWIEPGTITQLIRSATGWVKIDDAGSQTFLTTVSVPTTINQVVPLGTFTQVNGAFSLTVDVVVSSLNFSVSKTYQFATSYNETANAWRTAIADKNSGPYTGQDFDLQILQNTNSLSFRLRRKLGTTAGTAVVRFKNNGTQAVTFAPQAPTVATDATNYALHYPPRNFNNVVARGVFNTGDLGAPTLNATENFNIASVVAGTAAPAGSVNYNVTFSYPLLNAEYHPIVNQISNAPFNNNNATLFNSSIYNRATTGFSISLREGIGVVQNLSFLVTVLA